MYTVLEIVAAAVMLTSGIVDNLSSLCLAGFAMLYMQQTGYKNGN